MLHYVKRARDAARWSYRCAQEYYYTLYTFLSLRPEKYDDETTTTRRRPLKKKYYRMVKGVRESAEQREALMEKTAD